MSWNHAHPPLLCGDWMGSLLRLSVTNGSINILKLEVNIFWMIFVFWGFFLHLTFHIIQGCVCLVSKLFQSYLFLCKRKNLKEMNS